MIKIENVNKFYGSTQILSNINLDIKEGDIFGIIGLSGAGKSTLIRLINGLEKVTSGKIYIENTEITSLVEKDLRKIRKNIGMIFQGFNLLTSRTVFQNIAFPMEICGVSKSIIKERVNELIKLVGLEGKENFYPKSLSGGQKQRVGIARALANKPKILLCDEATSALDPNTTKSILNLIKDIQKQIGLTVVIITHEMDVIHNLCNKLAVLNKGEIVETGIFKDIYQHPKNQITKEFIIKGYDHTQDENIDNIIKNISGGKFIKIYFNELSTKEPIIAELIINTGVKINIIEAFITNSAIVPTGQITAHINDTEENFQKAVKFLEKSNVQIEVIDNEL